MTTFIILGGVLAVVVVMSALFIWAARDKPTGPAAVTTFDDCPEFAPWAYEPEPPITAQLDGDGTLIIEAQTAMSRYTLKCWAKENPGAVMAKLEIRTGEDGRKNKGYEA